MGRNRRMLAEWDPDYVVHFPGGNGTRHMKTIAMAAGKRVLPGLGLLTGGSSTFVAVYGDEIGKEDLFAAQ